MKRTTVSASVLAIALIACVNAAAADKQYAYGLDYSAIPADILNRQITISVSVGTAALCNVTADGAAVANNYDAASGTCWFSLTQTASSLVVTAVNWTAGGTGAATKTTLFNNKKWAYSFTFDDGYATDYTVDYPMFSAKNLRAGMAIVTSWIGGGNYMSRTQLTALYNAGWSVFNHSTSHPQNTISCSNLATYVGAAKTTLESWFPTNYKNIYYVYPYLETGYETCLSTAGYVRGAEGVDGLNYADNFTSTNFFGLYRHGMYASVTSAQANAWADAAASSTRPAWMITFTHMTYSGTSTPGTYDTNEATLQAHINYVYSTYGDGGTSKNMWFAPSDEVLSYLFTRQYLVINTVTAPTPTRTPASTSSASPTRTNSPLATMTASPSQTPAVPTSTFTRSATPTFTRTNSSTPTSTATSTSSAIQTSTNTATCTYTSSRVPTYTFTATATAVSTSSASPTSSPTSTHTSTPVIPTETYTQAIYTPTNTALIPTSTGTPVMPSATQTATYTEAATPVNTRTPTFTATPEPSATLTEPPTNTFTAVNTSTPVNTATPTPQNTPTNTPVSTFTRVPTAEATPSSTSRASPTDTVTLTQTEQIPSPTFTATLAATGEALKITVNESYPNPCDPRLYDLAFSVGVNKNIRSFGLKIFTASFRLVRDISVDGAAASGKNTVIIGRRNLTGLASGTYYYMMSAVSDDGSSAISKPGCIIILNR